MITQKNKHFKISSKILYQNIVISTSFYTYTYQTARFKFCFTEIQCVETVPFIDFQNLSLSG